MTTDKLLKGAAGNPLGFALGAVVVLAGIYFLTRKALSDAASAVGGAANGVLSGNNALTANTPYSGTGIIGTVGAGVNLALGGVPGDIGTEVGSWFYDLLHTEYDPNLGKKSAINTVSDGARATDALWGPVGSVVLKQGGK